MKNNDNPKNNNPMDIFQHKQSTIQIIGRRNKKARETAYVTLGEKYEVGEMVRRKWEKKINDAFYTLSNHERDNY